MSTMTNQIPPPPTPPPNVRTITGGISVPPTDEPLRTEILSLKSGDVLVVHVDAGLTDNQIDRVAKTIASKLDGQKVLILRDARLTVLRKEVQ